MSSDEHVVTVKSLSKTYRLFSHPGERLKQALTLGFCRYYREYTAISNINFNVSKGETIGIIGSNGSGKSTLLQLICGILKPTTGEVHVRGRISALLELGSGFNPEFTGKENIYFQAILMGLNRAEVERRFDDIASFAYIGRFLNEPVRTYSSGMFVRLAFAVAISFEPDVLVVDEALAVGDARFQSRCFRKIQQLRDQGGSILFVSHALEQVKRFCDKAILLNKGNIVKIGPPSEVVNHHLANTFLQIDNQAQLSESQNMEGFSASVGYNPAEYRFGIGGAKITNFCFEPHSLSNEKPLFNANSRVKLIIRVKFFRDIQVPTYAIAVSALDGSNLFGTNIRDAPDRDISTSVKAGQIVDVTYDLNLHLAEGDYLISLSVSEEILGELLPLDRRYDSIFLSVVGSMKMRGFVDLEPNITFERHQINTETE